MASRSRKSLESFGSALRAALGSALRIAPHARERERLAALDAAVRAQVLDDDASRLQRVSATLLEVLERNHDASSALSTSLLDADLLVRRCGEDGADRHELLELATSLRDALRRFQRSVEEIRRLGQESAGTHPRDAPLVDVAKVAAEVVRDVARRFPDVAIAVRTAASGSRPHAAVQGGEESLHGILENVLVNACEGDGRRGARNVTLTASADARTGGVAIEVCDDGGGFAPEILVRPIAAFATTKPEGHGLGLYIVHRLMRASGGSITRENRPGGGAMVALFFFGSAPERADSENPTPIDSAPTDSEL